MKDMNTAEKKRKRSRSRNKKTASENQLETK